MAFTVAALTLQVQNRLDDASFSSAMILQFLNDAQREYTNGRMMRIMETSTNYTLAVGVSDLTNGAGLPAAFQTPIDIRITTVGSESVLYFMDPKEFDLVYPQPSLFGNNQPNLAYRFGATINVFPTPDRAYAATLRYYKTPTELVNTTDVPEIPSEWQELLVTGALWRCHQFNDNYDMAAVLQGRVDEQLTDYTRRMSLAKTQPSIMKINGNSLARR